jgi:ketosteroid isomerase-like protein
VTPAVSRDLIRSYFQACISRDPSRIASYLDADVTWSVTGPIDLLPFCGQHRGKDDVIDTIVRVVPSVVQVKAMKVEEILIDGNRAATFMQISGILGETGRTVSYRGAQFLRFREAKLVELRGLIDSFDAAEQVLGHPIAVAPSQTMRADVVAV